MKRRTMIIFTFLITCYPFCLFADDLFIITHTNRTDAISKDQIKEIFMGQKTRWSNNEKINFVILKDKNLLEKFLKEFVGKTISQYTSYCLD